MEVTYFMDYESFENEFDIDVLGISWDPEEIEEW